MCLGHKAFGLPQAVADLAVIGLGLHIPGFVVVAVLDEVVAQADDVGQLLFCGAHRLNGGVQPGVGGFQLLDVLLCLKALVSTVLADGGQHLAGHPALESLGLGHLAAQDQAVQTGLVDNEHFLLTGGGVHFRHPSILRVYFVADSFGGFLVPQRHGNVLADEPRCAVDLDGAHLPELGISECGQVVHGEYVPPYFRCVLI